MNGVGGKRLVISVLLFVLIFVIANYSIGSSILSRISTGILGIVSSIYLSNAILKNKYITNLLLPLSSCTYTIYLLSWFGQYPIQILSINILHINWLVSFFLIFIADIVFPVFVNNLVNRQPIFNKSTFIKLTIGH